MIRTEGMNSDEFRLALKKIFDNKVPLAAEVLGVARQTIYVYASGKGPIPPHIRNQIILVEAHGLNKALELIRNGC